ncbi:MAG: cyclophilin-like family protein [Euryarchaeota archaeon]|nr:cyclophilin-like family protein [Euryarchaeota archaeon]
MVRSLARIRVVIGDARDAQLEVKAELFDDLCHETISTIPGALPITGIVSRWGDEIYFSTSVIAPEENPKELVEIGDLGYWLPQKAFRIFFGPTLASKGDEIRPASSVNVFERIVGGATVLKRVSEGERIVIDR